MIYKRYLLALLLAPLVAPLLLAAYIQLAGTLGGDPLSASETLTWCLPAAIFSYLLLPVAGLPVVYWLQLNSKLQFLRAVINVSCVGAILAVLIFRWLGEYPDEYPADFLLRVLIEILIAGFFATAVAVLAALIAGLPWRGKSG